MRALRALVFVYIIEQVAHAHSKNTPLEWFSSTPGLGVAGTLQGLCPKHYLPSGAC